MHNWGEKDSYPQALLTSPKSCHYFHAVYYVSLSSNKNYMSDSFPIYSSSLFAHLMKFYVFKCTSLPSLWGDLANGILLISYYRTPGSPFLICITYLYSWMVWVSTQMDSWLLRSQQVKVSPKHLIEWLSLFEAGGCFCCGCIMLACQFLKLILIRRNVCRIPDVPFWWSLSTKITFIA